MVWTNKKPVKPWIINPQRDPCDCAQKMALAVSGYSEKQGPTHYCPVCRWGFWTIEMIPSADQIALAKIDHPEACQANMKYFKLCNKPIPKWGSSSETMMVDQFGKLEPQFLSVPLKKYWINKYCDKYPNSEKATRRAKKLKEEKEKQGL